MIIITRTEEEEGSYLNCACARISSKMRQPARLVQTVTDGLAATTTTLALDPVIRKVDNYETPKINSKRFFAVCFWGSKYIICASGFGRV